MKIRSVNYTNSILKSNTEHNNSGRRNPAFGNALVGLASFIENNGFMGEFLTIDTCGMGIPRTGQGYLRNREELGHLNYKAGREEFTREILSGPAFFFVPLLTIAAFALAKGKSAKVPRESLANLKKLASKTEINLKDAAATKKNFVKTVIKEAFSDYKEETELVERFSNLMEKHVTGKFSLKDKVLNIFRKSGEKADTKDIIKEQAKEVLTKLNKANEKYLNNAGVFKVGEKVNEAGEKVDVTSNVKNFFNELTDYLDDFTRKASSTTKEKASFIDSFHKQATALRTAAEVSSIAALSAFIAYVPKLYQTGNEFPGVDGLVNGQTVQPTQQAVPQSKEAA